MMKSVRSFIRTMTPTPHNNKKQPKNNDGDKNAANKEDDGGTPDTAAESPVPYDDTGTARPSMLMMMLDTPGNTGVTSPQAGAPQSKPSSSSSNNHHHDDPSSFSFPALFQLLDTQVRVNMGTSVKCGICLSTIQGPTKTPCGHAFCKGCILASLCATPKCPECNTPLTKRGLHSSTDHLEPLAKAYKQLLVEFGFTPSIYQAGFTTLTQKPMDEDDDEEEDDDDDDGDNGEAAANRAKQSHLDRLHVAATWQQQALPQLQRQTKRATTSSSNNNSNNNMKIQVQENELIVKANRQACERAGWTIDEQQENAESASAATTTRATTAAAVVVAATRKPPAATATASALPNTQEILDGAREQQEADYELLERSFEEEQEEEMAKDDNDDDEDALQDLHHHGTSEGTHTSLRSYTSRNSRHSRGSRSSSGSSSSNNNNKQVSFQVVVEPATAAAIGALPSTVTERRTRKHRQYAGAAVVAEESVLIPQSRATSTNDDDDYDNDDGGPAFASSSPSPPLFDAATTKANMSSSSTRRSPFRVSSPLSPILASKKQQASNLLSSPTTTITTTQTAEQEQVALSTTALATAAAPAAANTLQASVRLTRAAAPDAGAPAMPIQKPPPPPVTSTASRQVAQRQGGDPGVAAMPLDKDANDRQQQEHNDDENEEANGHQHHHQHTIKNKNTTTTNLSGLVEDSFGALHWTNRCSLTLTPPDDKDTTATTTHTNSMIHNDDNHDDDDDEEPPLSFTLSATYDDFPENDDDNDDEDNDSKQCSNSVDGEANAEEQPQKNNDKNKEKCERQDDDDDDDDSQETKLMEGGRPSTFASPCSSSSDATVPMTMGDEQDSDASPSSSAPNSTRSSTRKKKDGGDDGTMGKNKDDASDIEANYHASSAAVDATTSSISAATPGVPKVAAAATAAASGRTTQRPRRRARSEPITASTAAGRGIENFSQEEEQYSSTIITTFSVGDIVNVQARTWSGINKPGGVARITQVHSDGSYNVAYVLGGKESNVDSVFVSASEQQQEEGPGKRRRRDTTDGELPMHLLQALAAQGFDTTGAVTLERAQRAAATSSSGANKKEEDEDKEGEKLAGKPRSRKSNPSNSKKNTLKDVSNQISSKSETNASAGKKTAPKKRKSSSTTTAATSSNTAALPKQSMRKTKSDSVPTEKSTATDPAAGQKRKSGPMNEVSSKKQQKKSRGSASGTSAETSNKAPAATQAPKPLSNEEAVALAGNHYKRHFEDALKEKIIYVVASGLNEHDTDILKALTCKPLEGDVKIKISDTFGKKTTLCVTPVDKDTTTKNSTTRLRTAKAMRASMAGIPIVSPAWVQTCAERNAPVVPSADMLAYSLPAKTDSISTGQDSEFGVAHMAAQLAQKAPLPLHQHWIFFCGDLSGSRRKDLQLLAREAGAKVLASASAVSPKLGKSKVVLVCHDTPTTGNIIPTSLVKQVQTALTEEPSSVLVVNPQWIFESITCAKALPIDVFAPVNSKAKVLWEASLPQQS